MPLWTIWLFIALALLRGLVYAAVIPPWQSPDEHGHFEYAWLISHYGPFVGPGSISPEFQQRVLKSMARFDYWRLVHQPTPETLPSNLTDPSDPLLKLSRPQVGDERPLYYLITGGLLRLVDPDIVPGMYIGRIVSVLLYTAAIGVAALATRKLFPLSPFMQTVPPAFLLFLPMLGEMGSAVSSDAIGVLTSTTFFFALIPVFRDGLTWRRGGSVITALVLALASKKTTLFLVPTALLALPVYLWISGLRLSHRVKLVSAASAALLILTSVVLALIPGGDAAGWVEWPSSYKATRFEVDSLDGKAAFRIEPNNEVSQTLPPERLRGITGQQILLQGWARSTDGPAIGRISIWDNKGGSQVEVAVESSWQAFTLTHTVDVDARWVSVRLGWGGPSSPLLFDNLTLYSPAGEDLLFNGSAEKQENLLLDLLSDAVRRVGGPRHLVEQMLIPQSWSWQAWKGYATSTLFCFHSFWGLFGSQALPLPKTWYWVIELGCVVALIGNLTFIVRKPRRNWQAGYLFILMGGLFLLVLQTLLPLISMRGTYWLPQGRYLFPGVFAISVLIAWGFYQLLPRLWEKGLTVAVIGLMIEFDLLCLGYLIMPYFYSGTQ